MFILRAASHKIIGSAFAAALSFMSALPWAQTLPQDRLQKLLNERVSVHKKVVGIAAFTADEKGVQFAQSGVQSAGKNAPITPDTLFEMGSVTKTFTGLLLAELVVKGVVKLDDPVEKFLPENLTLRDSADAPIQLIDLATHRSGLPRLPPDFSPRDAANPYADYLEKALLASLRLLKGDKTLPRRDRNYEYSNFGYGLLGYVLGRADNATFAVALQQRVLAPLGLTSAFLVVPESARARFSDGHNEQLQSVPHWDFDVVAGAGGLRMSARDLARYAQIMLGNEKSPLAEAIALATREHAKTQNAKNTIGLGWIRGNLNDRSVLNHDGGTYGFSSTLWLDTSRKQASAAIANTFVPVTDIGLHALEPQIPPTDFPRNDAPSVALTAAQLVELTGIYKLSSAMNVAITSRGTQLFAQATGQGEFELFAKTPRSFFAKVAPITIEFEDSVAGKARGFTLNQNGNKVPAPRIE